MASTAKNAGRAVGCEQAQASSAFPGLHPTQQQSNHYFKDLKQHMNGAQALLNTLVESGVEVCFANPGTSEMQLVSAIGKTDLMRPVLCLFEGVVTGAADGYGRMADKPAATLLHVGSGFSNSMANLHNANRAGSPMVNIVGDHASYHLEYDAPLTSDLPGLADWASPWMRVADSPENLSRLGAEAVRAANAGNGTITTLIAPADHAWNLAESAAAALPPERCECPSQTNIAEVAAMLTNGRKTLLYAGGRALREENLERLGSIADKTGAELMCETFPARLQRGAGRVPITRLPYFAEEAAAVLAAYEQIVLVGTAAPVSFFAYPGKASWLSPAGSTLITLAERHQDIGAALRAVANEVQATAVADSRSERQVMSVEPGKLSAVAIGKIMNRHTPSNAVISDEGATSSLAVYPAMETAEAHDWLTLTGGAIGQGLPLALGAALACPERKVVALQADGSAMYTIQALWSMARENADVTVVLLNNSSYAILNIELERVGAGTPNEKTLSMLDLSNPDISFQQLAESLGVRSSRATTVAEFETQYAEAMANRGPRLIEAIV